MSTLDTMQPSGKLELTWTNKHLRLLSDEAVIATLGVALVPPTPAIAQDAARYRKLNVSLADGFAMATARAHGATVATFDRGVRRALPHVGLVPAPQLA